MLFSDVPSYLFSIKKLSFKGPGGVEGLDLERRAEVCAREPASVVSRGLPWSPVDDGTDNRYSSKVSHTTLGAKILMTQCIDHKTAFPDTPRHFRLAIEIPRKFPSSAGV